MTLGIGFVLDLAQTEEHLGNWSRVLHSHPDTSPSKITRKVVWQRSMPFSIIPDALMYSV